jgi:SAM-dependent methyltransferase
MVQRLRGLRHRGDQVECPLCGRHFSQFGPIHRSERAKCWHCGSLQRHRGLWLYLQRQELLAGVQSLLHVSPEWCLKRRLRPLVGAGYVTSEIEPGRADLTLDLTATGLPDGSFDAIVCLHVLEHIEDDAAAMREMRRLLRASGGWAIVMVPIDHRRERTLEDPGVKTPEQRRRAYRQSDHVRLYAPDVAERLTAAGFDVERASPARELGREAARRYGLLETDHVFLCRPAAQPAHTETVPAGPPGIGSPA